MNWVLIVDTIVYKRLRVFPKKDCERITMAIRGFVVNPYAGDIEKMEGEEDVWRRRVGAYRIFYEVSTKENVIHVFDVKRRTSKTYD